MAAEQDRRSRMVNSSVNGTVKKGGAGGSYTWGAVGDVKDYEPVGLQGGYGVITAAASPAMATSTVVSPSFQMTQGAFPALGSAVARPLVTTSWGPSVTQNQLTASALRPGALEVIDSTHPRNMFAKKVYQRPAQEQLIDWSKAGVPDAVTKAITNAEFAHLSPYNQVVAAPVSLDVLRSGNRVAQTQYAQYTPTVEKHTTGSRDQVRQVPGTIRQPKKCC